MHTLEPLRHLLQPSSPIAELYEQCQVCAVQAAQTAEFSVVRPRPRGAFPRWDGRAPLSPSPLPLKPPKTS